MQAVAIDYTYKDSIEPSESDQDKNSLSYKNMKNRLDEITSKGSKSTLSDTQKNKILKLWIQLPRG